MAIQKTLKKLTLKDAHKLTKRAQKEIARLLAQEEAGTITRRELKTGLQEVEGNLNVLIAHHFKFPP